MTTSIALQLKNLKTPQSSLLRHTKFKSSLLFDAKVASNYSRDTFYQIGYSGFVELEGLNNEFSKFKETLFGSRTKEFQRAIQSKEENKTLDKNLEQFLLLLSPYLQLEASCKALEWLIQRFFINTMNEDSLIMCALPHHETALFTRIMQLIKSDDKKSPWRWLLEYQKKGNLIPKETIFLQWATSEHFRNFLSNYFLKMRKIHKNEENWTIGISFFMTTQIGGLNCAAKIEEEHISSICRTLHKCIASRNDDLLSGTLLMISQLSFLSNLSGNIIDQIIVKICKNSNKKMMKDCALCLLSICYHQNLEEFSPSVVEALEQNTEIVREISNLAGVKPVAVFFSSYVYGVVKYNSMEMSLSASKKKEKVFQILELIQTLPIIPKEATKVIRSLIDSVSECNEVIDEGDLIKIMGELEASHPEGFDAAAQQILKCTPAIQNDQLNYQQKILKQHIHSWEIKLPEVSSKDASISKEGVDESSELQWLQCVDGVKHSNSLREFLRKVCDDVHLAKEDKQTPFWKLSLEKDEFSLSLQVMVKLLKVLVVNQINNRNRKTCNMLLKEIFEKKLGDIKSQIYFLSMVFGSNLDLPEAKEINHCVKLWTLHFTSALITFSSTSSSLSWVLDPKEPLIAYLITPICEEEHLCEAAFKVLGTMKSIIGGHLRANSLSAFVQTLMANKEEITADTSYFPAAVETFVNKENSLGKKLLESFVACVNDEKVPLHIKNSILYALSSVKNQEILDRLLPLGNMIMDKIQSLRMGELLDPASSTCLYYILLRFSYNGADFLQFKGCWNMFQRTISLTRPILQVSGEVFSPQELIVNYKVLQGLSTSNKHIEVLDVLITRTINSNNPYEAVKLHKELKKINFDASQIISLWNKYDLVPKITTIKELRAKKLKIQKDPSPNANMENWRKMGLVVELVGCMDNLKNPWLLVEPLSKHLQQALKKESSFADVLQQQILSVLFHLLETSRKELNKEEFIKLVHLNIGLIVQCIRTTVNPDTHRRALLILSLAANYFPEQILHNIMAIFTFMGTSLLRRDDSYSFQVIHQTISTIVPKLIETENSDPNCLLVKLAQVSQVFVDALPDLAEHRRLPLFIQLARTFGVSQYLWLVMVLIADAYVTRATIPEVASSSKEEEHKGLPENIHFALVLYSQFSVVDQLKASCEVINFVYHLPDDKEVYKKTKTAEYKDPSSLIINIETHTSRQLRQLKYTCVGLLVHLLSSEKFVGQVFEYNENNTEFNDLKSLYEALLERALHYIKTVSVQEETHRGKPSCRFWSAMQKKLMDLVDSINSLLPPLLLVKVVSGLLNSSSSLIRWRAMEILASKLQTDSNFFSDSEAMELLAFIDPLMTAGCSDREPEDNRQTALFTLQLIIRKLNNLVKQEVILPVLKSCSDIVTSKDSTVRVQTQATLLIAELVSVLKVFAIPHLQQLVPTLLNVLQMTVNKETPILDNLVLATATSLHKMVENVPRLLSKYLEDLIRICCQLISKQEELNIKESRLTLRLTSILELLVHEIEPRVMIPALTKTYLEMSSRSLYALPSIMVVIESLIGNVKTSQLIMFKQELISLFTSALDIRIHKENMKLVEYVEGCVVSALSRFLLRLNEDDNITIFSAILHWAWQSKDKSPQRLITFFRFASQLADKLKVLFIKAKLANKVLGYAVKVLEENNNLNQNDTMFGEDYNCEDVCELLRFTLATLTNIFTYDSVKFTNQEKFDIILEPLTKQIENTIGGEKVFKLRISEYLKPCIIKFTVAVADDSLWKELNRRILQRIRTDNDSLIILAGLEICEGLMESLREDYLQPLLADTIPCITEVLESLDTEVEHRTKEIFNKMEAILGDNLRAYLET